jgi:hypothetical protein
VGGFGAVVSKRSGHSESHANRASLTLSHRRGDTGPSKAVNALALTSSPALRWRAEGPLARATKRRGANRCLRSAPLQALGMSGDSVAEDTEREPHELDVTEDVVDLGCRRAAVRVDDLLRLLDQLSGVPAR